MSGNVCSMYYKIQEMKLSPGFLLSVYFSCCKFELVFQTLRYQYIAVAELLHQRVQVMCALCRGDFLTVDQFREHRILFQRAVQGGGKRTVGKEDAACNLAEPLLSNNTHTI